MEQLIIDIDPDMASRVFSAFKSRHFRELQTFVGEAGLESESDLTAAQKMEFVSGVVEDMIVDVIKSEEARSAAQAKRSQVIKLRGPERAAAVTPEGGTGK